MTNDRRGVDGDTPSERAIKMGTLDEDRNLPEAGAVTEALPSAACHVPAGSEPADGHIKCTCGGIMFADGYAHTQICPSMVYFVEPEPPIRSRVMTCGETVAAWMGGLEMKRCPRCGYREPPRPRRRTAVQMEAYIDRLVARAKRWPQWREHERLTAFILDHKLRDWPINLRLVRRAYEMARAEEYR